ncbi:ketosteroid isomerase-like protein [Sphingomonas kaistensis]|uniref:Ketosteroid isomerase-like protein n=1 Tax=Sphingomonas kaistensis TaxID=298708 RepID=A0A7X5Y967_9SPHN|nr:nuclear transport factor 2 family protein [Sphingomonas kaistensis]NJC06872.1 ketosteroid isomerase-like protein [Sphingomonas kaistensis]
MLKLIAFTSLLAATGSAAAAAPADEAAKAIATTLDKFNAGDVQAFIDAHTADAVITDEFAPYLWSGEGSVKRWLDDYAKDAAARKIENGRVLHGRQTQASSFGERAYVVLPTTYCMTEAGIPKAGEGHMTFVMTQAAGSWKIAGWTYSAPSPTAYTSKQGKCGKAK